jgi:hypothetical protein
MTRANRTGVNKPVKREIARGSHSLAYSEGNTYEHKAYGRDQGHYDGGQMIDQQHGSKEEGAGDPARVGRIGSNRIVWSSDDRAATVETVNAPIPIFVACSPCRIWSAQ